MNASVTSERPNGVAAANLLDASVRLEKPSAFELKDRLCEGPPGRETADRPRKQQLPPPDVALRAPQVGRSRLLWGSQRIAVRIPVLYCTVHVLYMYST